VSRRHEEQEENRDKNAQSVNRIKVHKAEK
jgi:hypothetical protein